MVSWMCCHPDWPDFFTWMFCFHALDNIIAEEALGHCSKLDMPVECDNWPWGWCSSLHLCFFWSWFFGPLWTSLLFSCLPDEFGGAGGLVIVGFCFVLFCLMAWVQWHSYHVDPLHFKSLPSSEPVLQSRDSWPVDTRCLFVLMWTWCKRCKEILILILGSYPLRIVTYF